MLVAFNAAPGTVAPKGQGPYGAHAQALAEMMREGGLPVAEVFDRVRLRVNEITKGAEVPWSASKAVPPFMFFERAADAPPRAAPPEQVAAIRSRPIRELGTQEGYVAALDRDTVGAYEEFVAAYPDDPLARRVHAILAIRREAIVWRPTCVVDTPDAYWSYLERYPKGPHVFDARRRLARLAAALEPPTVFAALAYDVPPPPPEEIVYLGRPVLVFDDPVFALPPPPPSPIFLLPPPPPEFVILPPPPPIGLFMLPVPIYRPVPVWVRPPVYVAPPPPNNIIFTNVHNTVVINQTTNTVNITTPSGQPVPPPAVAVQPSAAFGASPQSPATAPAAASAIIGPSLPPSVARRASLIQGPGGPNASPAALGQTQPVSGAAPTRPGQTLPGQAPRSALPRPSNTLPTGTAADGDRKPAASPRGLCRSRPTRQSRSSGAVGPTE